MKTKFLTTFLIISAAMLLAGAEYYNFTATSSNGNVVLNWKTTSETDLKYFGIERKTLKSNYIEIGKVYPKADKDYEFVDQTAFKTSDQIYVYQLQFVDNSGAVSYSQEVRLTHSNISSVKRTWGSIKALFR